MATRKEILEVDGREVTISNPDKVYFPETGYTKMDLVSYYLSVADGALRGAGGRPMALKRFVDGAAGEPFFQKRAPDNTPDWIRTAELTFPSGRTADEIVLDEPAGLAWVVNLGCIDLNPHPVRAEDLGSPYGVLPIPSHHRFGSAADAPDDTGRADPPVVVDDLELDVHSRPTDRL